MGKIIVFRNEDIKRVLIGIPKGHKHVRAIIETEKDCILIFQEATIANLCRAYMTILTHPIIEAIELKKTLVTKRKKNFAEYQLLESGKDPIEVSKEINEYIK